MSTLLPLAERGRQDRVKREGDTAAHPLAWGSGHNALHIMMEALSKAGKILNASTQNARDTYFQEQC